MKKLILIFILPLVIVMSVPAQKAPFSFGSVTAEELKMKNYPGDTSASAVVLFDYGYFNSASFQFTRTIRIKILRKAGSEFGTNIFPVGARSMIKGVTFNLENGSVKESKLRNESIFSEHVTDNFFRMRVAMPDIREGSVFDIMITYPGLPGFWKFQSVIPVRYSELVIEENAYVKFTTNFSGFIPLELSVPGHWVARNMPAFKPEPFMNSEENYLSKLEIDLQEVNLGPGFQEAIATWNEISNILSETEKFGKALDGSKYLNEVARNIARRTEAPAERIRLAYDTVKYTVRWNEKSSLLTSNGSLGYVYRMQVGNSADINLILVQLLSKLGIEAIPVLMSTRDNGILSPLGPSINKLNYVIVRAVAGGQIYLLDATEPYMPYYLLPTRSLNYRGQTYDPSGSKAVEIGTVRRDKKVTVYDLKVLDDLSLSGTLKIVSSDYAAFDIRKKYRSTTGLDAYLEEFIKGRTGFRIRDAGINNIDSLYLPVEENYELSLVDPDLARADIFSFNPLFYDQMMVNPFASAERNYPVDFVYGIEKTVISTIAIPDKFTVNQLPGPVSIKVPGNGASFFYEAKNNGSTIRVSTRFLINKAVFSPAEYKALREFYDQVIRKEAEPVILKKI